MRWYKGHISDAITAAKKKSAIFVVYIEGKDDASQKLTELINMPELTQLLENDKFVGVKIEADSYSHQQFVEIYHTTAVPAMFFIGRTGQPLDIISEAVDLPSLKTRIEALTVKAASSNLIKREQITLWRPSSSNFIKSEQTTSATPASSNCIQSEQTTTDTPASSNLIKSEQTASATPATSNCIQSEQTTTATPTNVVCENGVCTIKKKEETSSSSSELTAEEKLKRAKELVEKQNKQKEIEEKEKERLKELERRKMGQDVQQLKRWQEDQELKQLKEERDKEKRENQAARDRVLAQIAQDKAERASRFGGVPAAPSTSAQNEPKASPPPPKSDTARLQFKLPDGSSQAKDFPSSNVLQSVRDFIAGNLKLNFTSYTLSTTFPRREFTEEDNTKSLLDLQLVPNAVILILPINKGAISTSPDEGFSGFMWSLFQPILTILGYIKIFLFGGNTPPEGQGGSYGGSSSANRGRNTVLHVRNKYDLTSKLSGAGSKLVVIDFFATWCGPCKMIAPKLEDLAREFGNVVFLKVDVDQNSDIARDYKVSAMPTFAFIKNKRVVTKFSGADEYQLRDTIVRYK